MSERNIVIRTLRGEKFYVYEDSFPSSMVENTSGFRPAGHRVLILPDQIETKTASGIITSVGMDVMREEMAQINGLVVALGSTCYEDQSEPWCAVGDTVIFAKYAGLLYDGDDGKKYRIINDLDVVGVRGESNE